MLMKPRYLIPWVVLLTLSSCTPLTTIEYDPYYGADDPANGPYIYSGSEDDGYQRRQYLERPGRKPSDE